MKSIMAILRSHQPFVLLFFKIEFLKVAVHSELIL